MAGEEQSDGIKLRWGGGGQVMRRVTACRGIMGLLVGLLCPCLNIFSYLNKVLFTKAGNNY